MAIKIEGSLVYLRLAVVLAGISGIVQSLAYIGLTIAGIVVYWTCDTAPSSDALTFGALLKNMYFIHADCSGGTAALGIQSAEDVFIWQCVYLGISVVWLGFSYCLIHFVQKDNLEESYGYIHAWVYTTIIICAVDFAFGLLFGLDIHYLNQINSPVKELLKVASGVMMTIVLRGFILYLDNLLTAVFLVVCLLQINRQMEEKKKATEQHNILTRGPISAYDNNTIEQRSSHWLAGINNMERPHISEPNARTSIYNKTNVNSYSGDPNIGAPNYYSSPDGGTNRSQGIMKRPQSSAPPLAPWERGVQREPNTPIPDYSPPSMRQDRLKPALKPMGMNQQYQRY